MSTYLFHFTWFSTLHMTRPQISFAALDEYRRVQKEQMMYLSMPDTNDGKKTNGQDGKKRKAAVQASKGVEKLKKANTKGMAKLSSFFKPKP